MIASLPMYWRAENAALWRGFWAEVQAACALDLPDLTPPDQIPSPWTDHWLRGDLALSATCSLPLRDALMGHVTYVGTLGHGVCDLPGHYFSHVIQRPDSGPPQVMAVNEADSHSGWGCTQGHPRTRGITRHIVTGSHAASLRAVATGAADIAFIDATTWAILRHSDPLTEAVEIVDRSAPSPAHALITALGNDPAPLRAALQEATQRFPPDQPDRMGGQPSFHLLDESRYHDLPIPGAPAADLG